MFDFLDKFKKMPSYTAVIICFIILSITTCGYFIYKSNKLEKKLNEEVNIPISINSETKKEKPIPSTDYSSSKTDKKSKVSSDNPSKNSVSSSEHALTDEELKKILDNYYPKIDTSSSTIETPSSETEEDKNIIELKRLLAEREKLANAIEENKINKNKAYEDFLKGVTSSIDEVFKYDELIKQDEEKLKVVDEEIKKLT